MGRLSRLSTDRSGAAAAEMALVAPLLIILMFGAFETGKFFWDEHIATNETQIRNVVRYGNPAPSGTDKLLLYYWTSPSTVTVAIDCYANAGVDGARVYDGIYTARSDVPRVTVSATVPYTPLLSTIGFSSIGLNLKASSEATVFGL